jgi:hypothetical protein
LPLNYVAITGTFDDGSGNPLSGSAVFTPSETVYASGVPVASAANPVSFPITGGILTGARLLATDNSPLSYEGLTGFFYWSVVVTLAGVSTGSWSFFLPHTPSTVDLFSLANTAAGGGGATLPLTTFGDLLYENATPAPARLPGNSTAAKQFLTQTGTGSSSAAPAWGAIAPGDVPPPAWQFAPKVYGAKGDGQYVTDGAMGSGLAVLTSASGKFTAGDVGKIIQVKGAAASGVTTLVTTIASYQSATQVTLTASNASGGAVSGALVLWATDDTAAIQAATNAAQAYAASNGYAQVFSPPSGNGLFYGIGGALVTGTPTYGNAQITIPIVAVTAPAQVLEFKAEGTGTTTHWHQTVPQLQGSTWVSFGVFSGGTAQGNSINANGDPCVLGGPSTNGYGGLVAGDATFSNMHVKLTGMNIITTHSANGYTYTPANLQGVAKCSTQDFSYSTTGLFLNGAGGGDFNTTGAFGNGFSKGFLPPNNGNNDLNDHRNLTCYGGYTWGLLATEHFDLHGGRILYCANGLAPVGTYGAGGNTPVGAVHKMRWSKLSIEGCPNLVYIFGSGSSGIGPFLEGTIDTEAGAPTFTDSGGGGMANALGTVTLTGQYTPANVVIPKTKLRVIDGQTGKIIGGRPDAYPFQFFPEDYGAKGNGKIIVDATVAGGSLSTLTSASASFTSADTGKSILVANGTTPFARTITFVNSTTVTLSSAAPGAVTSVGAIYGTDDTSAIQSAVNAAITYAQGNASAYGEVVFSQTLYCVAGPAVVGGGTLGNSQITLPAISAASGHKVNLALKGLGQVAASPAHWLNPNVNPAGATLVCMRTDGTYDATYGPASVIGGPVSGYGGGNGTFSNMTLLVDGLTITTPYYTSYGGLMLYGLSGMKIGAYSFMPMAVVVSSTVWPQFLSGGQVTGGLQYTAGLIAPTTGNNDISEVDSYTCYGAFVGVTGADHLIVKAMRTIFCGIGWLLNTSIPSAHNNHGSSILNWSCEATRSPIFAYNLAGWNGYTLSPGNAVVNVGLLSLESYTDPIVNADAAVQGSIWGLINFEDITPGGAYYANENNCPGIKLVNLYGPHGPLASPHAPPASGAAWSNFYYQDAWITLSATTSISALSIDSTAQNIAAGAKQQLYLPAGHSYTPTYTGTLSHSVTLL